MSTAPHSAPCEPSNLPVGYVVTVAARRDRRAIPRALDWSQITHLGHSAKVGDVFSLPATFRRTKQAQQRRMVHGLGQVVIKARLPGAIPVPFLPITCQGDEQRRVHAGQFA